MTRLLILLFVFVACNSPEKGELQLALLAIEIPNLEVRAGDQRLSMTNDGTLFFDSLKYSGYLVSYYPDQSIRSKKGYDEGKQAGNFITYYPNGQVYSQRPYYQGEKHGEHLGYHPDGQLKFRYYFVHGIGQGTHNEWYKNGKMRKEMHYKDGHEFGLQKIWRPDGKLRSNYVVRENGRRYGMLGLKRCAKIDSESGDIDPYKGIKQ